MSDKHVTGPIQVFVVGFDKLEATGAIMAELRRVRRRGVIRLVDVLFVQKDKHGSIENSMHLTDLSEAERERMGAIAGGLIGLREGGLQAGIVGAELGALAVAERDAGLGVDRLNELADCHPGRQRCGHPGRRAPLGGGPARRDRRGRWPRTHPGDDHARRARARRRRAAREA